MAARTNRELAVGPLRRDQIGEIHVLSIGVSKQIVDSGFNSLEQCENNSLAIRDCFLDYPQLRANPTKVSALTTKGNNPSRGAMIAAVKKLANEAGPDNRLLVYFSGHGRRIDEKLYLVPEDAFDSEDASCLVELDRILEHLSTSKAQQKILILDACWSGAIDPNSTNALAGTKAGATFFASMPQAENVAILASQWTQNSTAPSPDAKLSAFTYYLKTAFSGAAEGLEDWKLTISKLFDFIAAKTKKGTATKQASQEPFLQYSPSEDIPLGDFIPVFVQSPLALDQSPLHSIQFTTSESLRVKNILKDFRRPFNANYVTKMVNEHLPAHFEDDLGRTVAGLKNEFDFPEDDAEVDGAGIAFPGGRYWLEYVADTPQAGQLMKHVTISESWFKDSAKIAELLKSLDVSPTEMKLLLTKEIHLKQVVPGMKAGGWTLTSQLPNKAEFTRDTFRLVIETDSLTFHGFLPSELFTNTHTSQSKLARNVLQLLSNPSS